MSKQSTYDVFISHSTLDKQVADAVKQFLQSKGIRCWKAPDDIDPGRQWPEQIANAIDQCCAMVLVWSISSMESREVAKELTLAMSSGLTVIPLRLENIQPEGSFKYHLSGTHWLDTFDRPLEQSLADLAKQVLANIQAAKNDGNQGQSSISKDTVGDRYSRPLTPVDPQALIEKRNSASLIKWRESLWWAMRKGKLATVDAAALDNLKKSEGLDIDIHQEAENVKRDLDRFRAALFEVLDADEVDELSLLGLEEVRLSSHISQKEALPLLAAQAPLLKSNLLVSASGLEWIDKALSDICSGDSSSSHNEERYDRDVPSLDAERGITNKSLAFEECIMIRQADIEALGIWGDGTVWRGPLEKEIGSMIQSLKHGSKLIQSGTEITAGVEIKALDAHSVDKAKAGRLLLRINTSSFSGKNGVLLFDRLISIKNFWEKACHYPYYDSTEESKLDLDADYREKGFSVSLSGVPAISGRCSSTHLYDFNDVVEWNSRSSRKLQKYLKPLVSALAEKERLTSVALAATLEIQRLMELNEVSQLDIHRVIGYDGLKNDPKAAANAAKFICNDQVQPADIFLIIDTSMWSDCKEGIAYAVNGVFQKNIFEAHKHCPWQDVDDILPPTAEDPRIQIGNFLIGKDPDNIDAESDELDGLLGIGERLGAVAFASVELLGGIAFESEFRHCWLKVIASSASDKGWHELGLALRKKEHEAIRALGIDSEGLLIDCLHGVANEYEYMGGSQECASCHQELDNLYRKWIPQLEEADEKDEVINGALFSHANILSRLSKPLEAIPLRRRELAWCREKNGDTDPGTLTSINGLAIDLREIGELKEAEALFRELVTARQQILEPDDFQIGRAIGGLAKTLEAAGKLEEALIYSQKALNHRQTHEGPDDWWTNRERLDLARVLQKLGRYTEASALLTELQESMSRKTEPDDSDHQLITDAEELASSMEKSV